VLPTSRVLAPGEQAEFSAPALLVVGDGALDLTPSDTLVPAELPASSFRLAELEAALDDPSVLDAYAYVRGTSLFRMPDAKGDIFADALDAVSGRLLDNAFHGHCFFHLLEGDRRARLGLVYQRADGTSRVIVGAGRPDTFVRELGEWLRDNPRPTGTEVPRPRALRPSSPPLTGETASRFGTIETRSARFAAVLEELKRVAGTDLSILLLGESGTGKEHLEQAIHRASPRAAGPFVAVNCSALADNLIESELFGHRRGSFTGAHADRSGAFVAADGGTLLLDEIGDAPLRVQVALLRTLEAKTVRAVGADRDQHVDVRVLAVPHRFESCRDRNAGFRRPRALEPHPHRGICDLHVSAATAPSCQTQTQ